LDAAPLLALHLRSCHQATHIMRNPEVASVRSQVSRCSVLE
jgi:hypothetical protein